MASRMFGFRVMNLVSPLEFCTTVQIMRSSQQIYRRPSGGVAGTNEGFGDTKSTNYEGPLGTELGATPGHASFRVFAVLHESAILNNG